MVVMDSVRGSVEVTDVICMRIAVLEKNVQHLVCVSRVIMNKQGDSMKAPKLFIIVALLSVPVISLQSYDRDAFDTSHLNKGGPRMSNRCNMSSDCAGDEECSAFGMCEPR